jgi:hypothetical protein
LSNGPPLRCLHAIYEEEFSGFSYGVRAGRGQHDAWMPMRRLGVSRRDLFLELDKPALKSLPAEPYEYAEWRVRRVGLDYHVDIDGHYYSVPHRLIREQLDARITARTVELFREGECVAVHMRGAGRGRHTTIAEHMPSSHRRYAEWTIERIGIAAASVGPSAAKLAALILGAGRTPSRVIAPASASCVWRGNTIGGQPMV